MSECADGKVEYEGVRQLLGRWRFQTAQLEKARSHGTAMNIHEIDGAGRTRVSWCFVPKGYLVAGDIMLAQKIALETDERGALAVANRF